jgi:hypothetical protein
VAQDVGPESTPQHHKGKKERIIWENVYNITNKEFRFQNTNKY